MLSWNQRLSNETSRSPSNHPLLPNLLTLPVPIPFLQRLSQSPKTQRHGLSHPRRPLRMIPHLVVGVRMHERAQRTPINHQPRDKGPELLRREKVHFEHPQRVRADGLRPEAVDAEFGN